MVMSEYRQADCRTVCKETVIGTHLFGALCIVRLFLCLARELLLKVVYIKNATCMRVQGLIQDFSSEGGNFSVR